MNLPQLAVKYKPIVISLVLLSMAWGAMTFFTMSRREDPEFTIRVCVVSTQWPGASSEKVEELVTDKIEQQVSTIEEISLVRSTSVNGLSTVFVEADQSVGPVEIQNVWDKVRAKVALAEMPDSGIRPIVNDEFGDTAILVLAVHQTPVHGRDEVRPQDQYSLRQLEEYADEIEDAIRLLPGVAKVDKFGVQDEAIFIETDLGNWSQLNLTTERLERLAAERNIIQSGGQISTDSGHYSVKPGGELNAIEEISQIASRVKAGDDENSVNLSDLGLTVIRDYEDPARYICRYGDVDHSASAVSLGITMKSGANIIDICNASKERVRELIDVEQRLPPDIAVTAVSDQSENVAAKIQDVIVNVIEAILIVVVVVYLVVGFRTSFVMAANIPVVIIATIGLIVLFGVQLEQISLAAMIISLGLLVDNAVQVCDQARTNQINGMKPFPAAIEGANTLAIPMLVGTLTTMAAFVPMLFALEGSNKEYIYSLPVTVSTTLALSWILAMTLCVILAGVLIRVPEDNSKSASPVLQFFAWAGRTWKKVFRRKKKAASADDADVAVDSAIETTVSEEASLDANKNDNRENLIFQAYNQIGLLAVKYKWLTVAATVGLCAFILTLPVSSEFFPQANRDQFAVKVYLPETATIQQTDAVTQQVEEIVRKLSPIASGEPTFDDKTQRLRAMRTLVGGGGSRWHLGWDPEPSSRNFAEILIRTTDGRFTSDFANRVREVCERGDYDLGVKPIVGARIVPVELALGPPADPLLLRITGKGFADPNVLRTAAIELKQIVNNQPETWDVSDSWGVKGYELNVNVDKDQAALSGVTNSQVARTLNSYYSGLKLTTFREGDHQIPIYFRLRPEERESIRGLQESFVEGDKGKVPLASLASFEFAWEPAKIGRRKMNRSIDVTARMEPGVPANDVVSRVLNSAETKALEASLPAGYWIEPGGAYSESEDAGKQMGVSFLVSLVLIVITLVFQYNGWSKPLIVLGTLPLALVGAWLGLYLTDNSLGFMPQLGILALFGIVLNTAIIFIEFADLLIKEKAKEKREASTATEVSNAAEASGTSGPIVGLTVAEFRDCLIEAGKQRMLPIFLTTATTVGGLIPLALGGGPLWVGLAWCMIVGLLLTTVLTLVFIPAFYAVLVETFGVKPVVVE